MFISSVSTSFYEKAIYKTSNRMINAHFHDKNELYYLESGRVRYFIDNEIFLLEPGDMIFVPKNTFHKTDYSNIKNVERSLFTFDDDELGEDNQKHIDKLKKNKFIRIKTGKRHELQNIIHQIEKENTKKDNQYLKMQKLYFEQLLILISRHSVDKEEIKINKSHALAQDISKYITENYNGDLSLYSISKKFSMSESHLSRFFKAATGMGLSEYINISRITAAEKMLLNSQMPITQIATECGFNDSNYFAAVFKKFKGITPKKYALINK